MRQRKPRGSAKRKRSSTSSSSSRRSSNNAYRQSVGFGNPKTTLSDYQTIDTSVVIANVTNTFTNTLCFVPTPGTATSSRYGDRTIMQAIEWNFLLKPGVSQLTAPQYTRILLVYDRQCSGSAPTSPQPLSALSVEAFKDPDFRYRYTLIRDWLIPVQNSPFVGVCNETKRDICQRGGTRVQLVSQFNGNAGTVSDIQAGSLFLMCLNDTALGAANTPSVNGFVRVIFKS